MSPPNVLSHPVVNAMLSKLRQTSTSPKEFREGIHNISLILGVEATQTLEEDTFQGHTPVGPFIGKTIKPRIGLTPILRAGIGMTDALVSFRVSAPVYHLGLFREKVTLQPVEYYSKLPPEPPVEKVFLLDPLIATGGTACAALTMIVDWGIPVKDIKLLSVIASQPGLEQIITLYPELEESDRSGLPLSTMSSRQMASSHQALEILATGFSIRLEYSDDHILLSTKHGHIASAFHPPTDLMSLKSPQKKLYNNPRIPASNIVEYIASRSYASSSVYIYDVAEQVGFGTLTKEWAKTDATSATVVDLQTRAGAGLGVIGRLSEGTSYETCKGAVLTAYTTPAGLAMMAPSLAYLPPANEKSRLVIQVPVATPIGQNYALSATLAQLTPVWPIIPQNLVVLISSTPQQTVDFASISYKLHSDHVIHLFDHQGSAREIGHSISPLHNKKLKTSAIADVLGQFGYSLFEFAGGAEARTLIVILNGPLALAAAAIAQQVSHLAVITINVLRPWDATSFRSMVPMTVTEVHVIDDTPSAATQGTLYIDVFEALYEGKAFPSIHSHKFTPTRTQQFLSQGDNFLQFVKHICPTVFADPSPSLPRKSKKLIIFNVPQPPLAPVAQAIENLFLSNDKMEVRLLTDHDIVSRAGGVTANRLIISPKKTKSFVPMNIVLPYDIEGEGQADFVAVLDQNLLKNLSLIAHAKRGSSILLNTSWSPQEILANISADVMALIHERAIRVFTINANKLGAKWAKQQPVVTEQLIHLAILRLYLGHVATEDSVSKVAQAGMGGWIEGVTLSELCDVTWSGLKEVEVYPDSQTVVGNAALSKLKNFEFNAISVDMDSGETVVNGARLGSWHDAAKHLLFPSIFTPPIEPSEEEYPQNPALRPEQPDRTYLVTCTINRRLTPIEYDRNVFHLEFDTAGTGLKYAIGEALGIHGWNDEQEVLDFCAWYGIDPNRLVTIPVVSGEVKMHTRTVFQVLQQQIDIFGKPPKSFYTDLAPHASNVPDKYALQFIGSPEGSATFKKLSEKDTITFADVLKRYPSARPSIERLCELIGNIKPRHYSIASSQVVVGNRVDLLVVTVEWQALDGSVRYGQCTRYLAGLKVGQKVTVSLKPSVMKLPPDPRQPLIMAGLGTGAAPFRAFLQYIAWRHERGEEIGPVYYYFGSRHQASEYLYGEEIESFLLDRVITRAGLAFSRDQPKKVYIQHKMLEDSEALAKMLYDDEGVFYLCGPTWPVPDVYNALVNALSKYKGMTVDNAGQYLEGLKEEERYVLEVY
ncbi:hypothetical protein AX15_006365 [Amanita polypyramis BW_CC]|nr:hypothetical protein AX15_006365 [Amanita polypyramis BW_CC]